MEKTITYADNGEKQEAMDAHASLYLIEDRRHIVGKDKNGNPIYEESLVFSDKPKPDKVLTLEERIFSLESRLNILDNKP